jgi:hypothetical protein
LFIFFNADSLVSSIINNNHNICQQKIKKYRIRNLNEKYYLNRYSQNRNEILFFQNMETENIINKSLLKN